MKWTQRLSWFVVCSLGLKTVCAAEFKLPQDTCCLKGSPSWTGYSCWLLVVNEGTEWNTERLLYRALHSGNQY